MCRLMSIRRQIEIDTFIKTYEYIERDCGTDRDRQVSWWRYWSYTRIENDIDTNNTWIDININFTNGQKMRNKFDA